MPPCVSPRALSQVIFVIGGSVKGGIIPFIGGAVSLLPVASGVSRMSLQNGDAFV